MTGKLTAAALFLVTVLLIQCQMQLSFASGSTIEGVVTDAYTNAPIPLAEVNIGTGTNWFERSLGSTRTDANGRYSIQVPISDQYQFIVSAKEIERDQYRFYDHCWSRRTLPHAPIIHADFALEPAGSILVKMFDLNGRPLGTNSMEGSWVKDVSLKSIAGERLDNRTYGHAYQPYRTDDEEMLLLSPETLTTAISSEITIPSYGTFTVSVDNGTAGFAMHRGDLLVLNLNYEVATAVYREFNSTLGLFAGAATTLRESTVEIVRGLAQAQADHLNRDDVQCATESNAALLGILSFRNDMWLKIPFITGHPRLLFTRYDLETLRGKVKSGTLQKMWKSVLADCDSFLKQAPPQLSTGYDAWTREAEHAVDRLEYLAFAYVITGDARYAAKANETVWAFLSWPSWKDPSEGNIPDLMSGMITAGVAIAYDWLFDYFTPEERSLVAKIVAEKGVEPLYEASVGGIWWSRDSHSNWNAVTHGGLGLAGLAFLGENPNASKWVGQAAFKILGFFDSGGRNGGWGEGLGYWAYGLSHALVFADALRRVTGFDLYQSVFLKETLYFPIYLVTPGLTRHVNFEDSKGLDLGWIAALTLRLSSEYEDGYGQTFFNMLWDSHGDDEMTSPAGPFVLIWYNGSVKPKSLDDLPLSRLFEGLGWIVVRSGWGPKDTLFAFKSGPNWNHGHADQNNFIFEAFGQPLIVDLGYGTPSQEYFAYGGSLDYHIASVGHNVILFDGQGQVDPRSGWSQPPEGRTITFQTYPGFESYEYVVGDASAAYSIPVRFIRQVIFVQHRFLLILDTVNAPQTSLYQWLLHTNGVFNLGENGFTITKNGVVLDAVVLLPQIDSHLYFDQNRSSDWNHEEPAPRLEMSPRERSSTATFLVVLYPLEPGQSAPKVTLVQNVTTWTVKVEDNTTHYLFFNHTTSPPTFLATRSQTTSLQQTTQDLLQTARNLLDKAKSEQLESPQATALVKSAESNYQEAAKANQSGDYERAATGATKSIAELANAFAVDTSWKQERTQTSILAIGITIITLGSAIAFLLYKRRKPKRGKMPRLRGQTL